MPANLTPQYFDAEKNFRAAKSPLEKITALEEMLAVMPKHKGTDHLRAELRTRIARLTQALDKKTATKRASMTIEKMGAAQVAVVGLPNAGKSRFISSVTNATPTIAEYPFTTHAALPGMMKFENIQIQLIDTPALTPRSIEWWLPPLLQQADALLVMLDLNEPPIAQMESIIAELEKMRIEMFDRKHEDEVVFYRKKALVAGNKTDLDIDGRNYTILQNEFGGWLAMIDISATEGNNLEELKRNIFRMLDIIRVYTKMPGQKPDFTDPIILDAGSTPGDAAISIHKDFAAKMKYARIWGSGKHDGIMAKRDHILQDGDVIELHM